MEDFDLLLDLLLPLYGGTGYERDLRRLLGEDVPEPEPNEDEKNDLGD